MDSELFDICVLYEHTVVFSGFLLLCVLLVKLISFHVLVGFVLFFCSDFLFGSHYHMFLYFFSAFLFLNFNIILFLKKLHIQTVTYCFVTSAFSECFLSFCSVCVCWVNTTGRTCVGVLR